MKFVTKVILALAIAAVGSLPIYGVQTASAQVSPESKKAACEGLGSVGADCSETTASNSVNSLIEDIINIFSFVVGVAAVIMLIIGGFKYITSNGDSNGISSAKSTILYAVIGLVVVAFAQIIVRFVLNRVT